jgi:ankyrin repeat protein
MNDVFISVCRIGDTNVAQFLLETGVNPSSEDKDGNTPLHQAAKNNHPEIVKLLLKVGVNTEDKNKEGYTALYSAGDNTDVVKLLLGSNANILAKNASRCDQTPLNSACRKKYVEIVRLMLKTKFKVSDMNNKNSPLGHATDPEIVKMLLQSGADPSVVVRSGYTPLHIACGEKNIKVVKLLTEAGSDLSIRSTGGKWTPLHIACNFDNLEIVKILLEAGSDPEAEDSDRRKAIDLLGPANRVRAEYLNIPDVHIGPSC